ncbi:MAG: porin family protein [Bacteroidota bacterium]
MKKFTNFFLVLMSTLFCLQLHAQTFGVRGGLSMANMLEKDEDGTYSGDYQMNSGFHAGVSMDFPILEMISFETGLLLNTKGFRITEEEEGVDVTAKAKFYYADIPLTFKVSGEVSEGVKLFVLGGPYIGIGLSGKVTAEGSEEGYSVSIDEDINWGSGEEDDLKRLDYGITAGAGLELMGIQVGLSYDFGLANVSAYTDYGTTLNHRVLKFSIGYRF